MVSPEQARLILDQAMAERLGSSWSDEESPWTLITGHDYMARVTNGRVNIDFYVDLLGKVTVEQRDLNPAQASGRLVAWVVLLVMLALAYLFARVVGWL